MNKLIKLTGYFLAWIPSIFIYSSLVPVYLVFSRLYNYPKKWFWWLNYSFFLFCGLFYIFYEKTKYYNSEEVGKAFNSGFSVPLIVLLVWAFFGGLVLRLISKLPPPYGKLKAYHRKLYPLSNKVKVTSNKGNDENMKGITSRLAPHLQELITKQ